MVIDTSRLSSVADWLVICGADSERQVKAVTDNIVDGLKKKGLTPIGVEGVAGGRWALLDYADVVVHVFHRPVRSYFDLEGLWADAPRLDVDLDSGGAGGGEAGGEGAG